MHKPSHFPKFLAVVMVLFIGILVYVWIEAKKANPVMLDERGNPRSAASP
jgi:hypothetical protein